ncbi:hypothetical protein EDD36DRAFT_423988 [Exophiala viscosa]|uniref:Zn(2)-C6 fungal-type domain-containing protein n=1 Tax=Exophiala viscosa TaxID=2486360 RepID=A0AAN6IJC9_9EURO|nr:hypothetical protein EDD36DRAFT_423988 [Exophiala viscosa]
MTETVGRRAEGPLRKMLAPRLPMSEQSPLNRQSGDRNHWEANTRRRPTKPRPIACQSCRQVKLRCEDSAGGTRPCQRCRELSRPCRVDTSYRRVNKRTAPENHPKRQAEQQYAEPVELLPTGSTGGTDSGQSDQAGFIDIPQHVAHAQETTTSHAPSTPNELSGAPDHDTFKNPGSRALTAPEGEPSQTYRQYHYTAQHARTIEMVTVEPVQIQHLFTVYFTNYHPCLPVIQPPSSTDAIYDISPLLFWTILVTAARHEQINLSLLQSLGPEVRSLLWATIGKPPYILPTLQAMCILCAWPFSASSMTQDITYLLGGILKTAALHAGLYQPDVYAHFSRTRYSLSPDEIREAARVWCCIYVCIESLAMAAGHVPHIYADRTIEQASSASNPYDLPTTLHQSVVVQMFCNKVHLAMGELDRSESAPSRPKRASTLRLLEIDFQELDRRLGPSRTHRLNIELLSASFQLRGYWLLEPQESPDRRLGISRAYDNVIDLASEIEAGDRSDLPLRYSSWSTYMICVAGAVHISKVIHSAYRPYVDVDKGKHAFNVCLLVLRQCSVEDNDLPGRSSKVVSQLWSIHQAQAAVVLKSPTLKIASRMLYSIVYDGLWLWREKFGGQPANGAPSFPPPFIPTSPSTRSTSAPVPPLHSPVITSNMHPLAGEKTTHQSKQLPFAVGSPPDLDAFIPELNVNSLGRLSNAVEEDFNPMWDVGFLNPSTINFNLPPSDFNMGPHEPFPL